MKITRSPTRLTSKLTVDEDLDFLDTYQVASLAAPAADEALRKGNKDIGNAEIADAAAIAVSKLVNTYFPETLLTAQGDMLTRSDTVPKKFVKGTAGHFLRQGANEPEWAAESVSTKEFFVWLNETESTEIYTGGARINLANEIAEFERFHIPHDFTTLVEAVAIVQGISTSTQRFDLASAYGAATQAYNVHTENDNDVDTSITQNQLDEIDVSGVLTGIEAGDWVRLVMTADATVNIPDCIVQGLRIKYT